MNDVLRIARLKIALQRAFLGRAILIFTLSIIYIISLFSDYTEQWPSSYQWQEPPASLAADTYIRQFEQVEQDIHFRLVLTLRPCQNILRIDANILYILKHIPGVLCFLQQQTSAQSSLLSSGTSLHHI